MVIEIEQPVDGSLRNAETARKLGLSQARGLEGNIELGLCCVERGEANHMVLPSARLAGTRHLLALPDQLSDHGANCVLSQVFGFAPGVSLGDAPVEVGEPDDETALFRGLENRGVFHATAPLFLATLGCSERCLS